MSFFSKKKFTAVLFSEMSGKITFNGKPVKNTNLHLSVGWNDGLGEINKSYKTDDKGYFYLPKIEQEIEIPPLAQFVSYQTILINHQGEPYKLWIASKDDIEEFTETEGKPINLICELTNSRKSIKTKVGLLGTLCTWDISK